MHPATLDAFSDELRKLAGSDPLAHLAAKIAKVMTPLLPHQQRVVDRIADPKQKGLVVVHGLGSGKTLTSIAAQEALGHDADVVVPAALQENYVKERKKHLEAGGGPSASIGSLQNAATKGSVGGRKMLIVDEAHRARDPASKSYQALAGNEAEKRLLLTGSPFYNHPVDLSSLVNLAAGENVLPTDPGAFERRFMRDRLVEPGLVDRWINKVRPGTVQVRNDRTAPELAGAYGKYVDYHPSSAEGFPSVERETVEVPMAKGQNQLYETVMKKAPPWVAAKVRAGLPPSKAEAAMMNTFLNSGRQINNTTGHLTAEGAEVFQPKIERAVAELRKELAGNPDARAVVYSNYLGSGIHPYRTLLDREQIPYGEFTGEMEKDERDEMVRRYNDGKLKALLLSSAGGEGLDLKGTSLMQILEPHWNNEKIRQVEGRGVRYKSHDHLPADRRRVRIQNYVSTVPTNPFSKALQAVGLKRRPLSADEYLAQRSKEKDDLIGQFRELLPGHETGPRAVA